MQDGEIMDDEKKERLALVRGAVDGVYTTKQVAASLSISERAVRRLKKKYIEEGESALVHGNAGRRPINFIDEDIRSRISDLKKSDAYRNISVSYFMELLAEREGIKISYTALSGILTFLAF